MGWVLLGLGLAQELQIYFLNVGQGDGVLLVSPEGKSLVYDGGRGREKALEVIRSLGISKVDAVIASHSDADHIGGLEAVVRELRPSVFINNGLVVETQVFRRVLEAVAAVGSQGVEVRPRESGPSVQVLELGSVKLSVLAPPPGMDPDDPNANSLGLLIEYGSFKGFFGGDSTGEELEGWQRIYGEGLKGLDLYKSAHHGSKHNDTAVWLEHIRPRDVVIGVGSNGYGHPAPEAIELYRRVGAEVWRTDQQGTIKINVRLQGGYAVKGEGTLEVARAGNPLRVVAPVPPSPTPPSPPAPPGPPPPTPPGTGEPIPVPTTGPGGLVGSFVSGGLTIYVYDRRVVGPRFVGQVQLAGGTVYLYEGLALPALPGSAGVAPLSDGSCPGGYPVKGNRGSSGKTYHLPGGSFYNRTRAEVCFATPGDAEVEGYRGVR